MIKNKVKDIMTLSKFERVIVVFILGFSAFPNSGCPLVVPVAMEITGANRYYEAVEQAERKRKEEEEKLGKKLTKVNCDVEYQKGRVIQTYQETARRLSSYSGQKDSLDELESSLEALRKEVIVPNMVVKEDYNKAKVLDHLYYDIKRIRTLRNSFGNYTQISIGDYHSFHTNEENIRRAIPELKSMKTSLRKYEADHRVAPVLKEVEETLRCVENYVEYLREISTDD